MQKVRFQTGRLHRHVFPARQRDEVNLSPTGSAAGHYWCSFGSCFCPSGSAEPLIDLPFLKGKAQPNAERLSVVLFPKPRKMVKLLRQSSIFLL